MSAPSRRHAPAGRASPRGARLVALLVGCSLAATACLTPTEMEDLLEVTTALSSARLTLGDSIGVSVTVRNLSERSVRLNGAHCPAPFIVVDGRPRTVGPEARTACTLDVRDVDLAPDESYTFVEQWRGGGLEGPLEPGLYAVVGRVEAVIGVARSQPVPVRIVR